jgi:hypothetical protein
MPNPLADHVIHLDSDGEEYVPETQDASQTQQYVAPQAAGAASQRPQETQDASQTQQYVAPQAAGGSASQRPKPKASKRPKPSASQSAVPAIPIFAKKESGALAMPTDHALRKHFTYCQGPTLSDDCPFSDEGGNVMAAFGSKKLGKVFCCKCYLDRAKIIKCKRIERFQVLVKRSKDKRKDSTAQDRQRKWGQSQKGKIDKEKERQKNWTINTKPWRQERAKQRMAKAAAAYEDRVVVATRPAPSKPPPPPPRQSNAADKEHVEMLSATGQGKRVVWEYDDDDIPAVATANTAQRQSNASEKQPMAACRTRVKHAGCSSSKKAARKKLPGKGPSKDGEGSSSGSSSKPSAAASGKAREKSSTRTDESEEEHEDEDEDEDDDARERRESPFHNLGAIKSRKSHIITAKITDALLQPAKLKNGKVKEHGLLYVNPWTGLFHERGQEFDGSVDMADADSPPKLKRSRTQSKALNRE